MGVWDDRFVTLATTDTLAQAAMGLRQEADAVAAVIRNLTAGAALGGTLYVPQRGLAGSGAWVVNVDGGLVVPEGVTLLVAPGAQLIPVSFGGAAGALELRGPVDAPPRTIFGMPPTAPALRADFPGAGGSVRPVRLTGDAQDRAYPEWWGAGAGDAAVDTEALREAIRAALTDRSVGTRGLRPLAVELVGPYRLRAPLALGSTTAVDLGVLELRGAVTPDGAPHLRCAADFVGDAMLVVEANVGLQVAEVHLDGGGIAQRCVLLRGTRAGLRADELGHVWSRGRMEGATHALLELQAASATRGSALVVEGTCFVVPESPPTRGSYALRLDTADDVVVSVRSASFTGRAGAMVRATGAKVSLTHCYFHNESPLVEVPAVVPVDSEARGGLDVSLGCNAAGVAASTSVLHCLSHSLRFLAVGGNREATRGRDSSLIALRHEVRRGPSPGERESLWDFGPSLRPPPDSIEFEPTPIVSEGTLPLDPAVQLQGRVLPASDPRDALDPRVVLDLVGTADTDPGSIFLEEAQRVLPPVLRTGSWGAFVQWVPGTALPPAVEWDGVSMGGAGVTLCGCRFVRPQANTVAAAVKARRLRRPVIDLGVRAEDGAAPVPMFDGAEPVRPVQARVTVWRGR